MTTCDRNGCNNIAKKTIFDDEKVCLCSECWQELLEDKDRWEPKMYKHEVRKKITDFVHTYKGSTQIVDTKKEFDKLTGNTPRGK